MKYTLSKSITISNGETVSELTMDFDALSLSDIRNARKVRAYLVDERPGEVPTSAVSPRLDENLRIGLAWVAACKAHAGLSIQDVLLLSAKDALGLSDAALEYLF